MSNNDFQVLIQAIVDAKDVQARLDAIKNLSVKIDKVDLDKSAIDSLRSQLTKNGIDVNLVLGNVNQIQSQAAKAGQEIGQKIQSGIKSVIQKGEFRKDFFFSESEINNVAKEAQKYFSDLSEGLVTVQESMESLGEGSSLNGFLVNIKNAKGEVEQLRYTLKDLTDDTGKSTGKSFSYSGGSINDNGVVKQFKAISTATDNLQLKLEKLKANYTDLNAPKAIKEAEHISKLGAQYDKVKTAIDEVKNADSSTLSSMTSNANKEIGSLETLVAQFKNAEYAATSLRTKDIATIKTDENNGLNAFVEKMKQSGHYTTELQTKVDVLKTDLLNVFDSNSLTLYLNKLSNLESEFKLVDATAKTLEKSTKLQVNINAERSMLTSYENEAKESGILTDELKQKIQTLYNSLDSITTSAGLTTWRAELKGVKSEITDVINSTLKINNIQLLMDNGNGVSAYRNQINKLISDFERYGVSAEKAKAETALLQETFDSMEGLSDQKLVLQAGKFEQEFKAVKTSVEQAKQSYDKFAQPVSDEKISSLSIKIQSFLNKNTAITKEARTQLEKYNTELSGKNITLNRWNQINGELAQTESRMRQLGKLGRSLKDQFTQAAGSFAQWISVSSLIMGGLYKTKEALSELKEIDTYLTEISKANDKLSKSDLSKIASDSFDVSGAYGKTATNYLSAVQEMSRAGYENVEGMAELSTAAQGAGDMTQELANKYIIATDKAYKLNGSVKELTKVMDGANYITNNNAVNMTELAEGMSVVGSQAASLGVEASEATAALGTMIATTQQGGSEMARAFKAILLNIRQVSDEEEGINAEGLTKYEKACNALNVKLKETKNGILQLRNPMDVLKDLSKEYSKLDENDIRRTNLLSSVGGKLRANALNALLTQWPMYEKMLNEYSEGTGSMSVEAEKTANSWQGSLNRLGNSWTKFIDSLTDQDAIVGAINSVSSAFNGLTSITDKIGLIITLLSGAGITAFIKNFSRLKDLGNLSIATKSIQALPDDFNNVTNAVKILAKEQLATALTSSTLSEEQKILIMTNRGLAVEEARQRITTVSLSSVQTTAATTANGFSTALKGLWATMKANPIMLLMAAVGAIIGIYSKWKQVQEENIQAAQDAASAYNESSKAIEDYTKKYQDLHTALLRAKNSEEDTYDIKKQLLDLQLELNDKYGDEYGKLNLVTDAYRDQTDALKELEKEQANKFLNESPGLDNAEKEMTKTRKYDIGSTGNLSDPISKQIYDLVTQYQNSGIYLKKFAPNDQNILGYTVHFSGDATQASKVINELETKMRELQNTYKDNNSIDSFINNSKNILIENKKILSVYDKTYQEKLKAEIKTSGVLSSQYIQAEKAVENYNEAVLKSNDPLNDQNVKYAYQNLNKIKSGIQDNETEWGKYSSITDELFKKSDTRILDFNNKISSMKTPNLFGDLDGKTDVEAKSLLNENEKGKYNDLINLADKYSLSIDDTISSLEKMGVVINTFTKDANPESLRTFTDIFSSLPIDKLEEYVSLVKDKTIDEKTIGNYKELSDAMLSTGTSAKDAIQNIQDYSSGIALSTDLTKDIQSSYDLLIKVKDEVSTTKQVSLESLNAIAKQFPELTTSTMKYAQGLMSTNDLMELLKKAYDSDANAFRTAISYKLAGNETFFNTTKLNNQGLFDNLAKAYGLDVNNWKTMSQAKAQIDQKLIKNLSDAWSKYYKIVFDSTSGLASIDGGPDLSRVGSQGTTVPEDVQRAWSAANEQKNKYNQAMKALDKAAQVEVELPDFDGLGKKSSNSNSSSNSKEPTSFDWMEQKITLLDSKIAKTKKDIESLVGYKNKNSMTDTAIDLMNEKMGVLQQMSSRYMSEANKIGLSHDYVSKIQNGTIDIDSVSDEKLVKRIQNYRNWYDKATDVQSKIAEINTSLHDLNMSKLDNVIKQFEQISGVQSQIITTEKQLLDLREKSGESVYAGDYVSLAKQQLQLSQQNAEAYRVLSSEMSKLNLEEGSEDWKKYNDQLQDYKNNMISAADAVEQYKDAMTALVYKDLNDFKSSMDSINGTIETMSGLIGDSNLVDEFGNLTDRGVTQVALYAQQLSNAKQEAAEYAEAIDSLDDALGSGLITQDEYNSMLQDYKSSQENAVKSTKSARDAILALVKEGIQAEIDAKKKLVDETKSALDAEKELHDYQKSITEKQDNISNLQRQINSLSNSTDRSDIAKKLELQKKLADAQKDLYETQYDKEINDRKEALDDEFDSFEESKKKESEELDDNLDAQQKAIDKYLEKVKGDYSTVYEVLKKYGGDYNLSAIEDLTSPWESGSNAADVCSNAVGNAIANIQYKINGLDFSPLQELAELLNNMGMGGYGDSNLSNFENVTNKGNWKQAADGQRWWYGNSNEDYVSDGIYTINGKQYGFDDGGYMLTGWNNNDGAWRYFEPENGQMVKSEWRKDSKGEYYYLDKDGRMATDMAVKSKNEDGYYYLNGEGKLDGGILSSEEVRKLGYRIGYRSGTRHATRGWHRTDEDGLGTEAVITNNGVFRQFEGGEIVFNSEELRNLYEIGHDPTKFIKGLGGTSSLDFNKLQPANSEGRVEVTMHIGGVLDEAAARVLSEEMPNMINKHQRQIGDVVYKDLSKHLLGK